MGDAIVRNFDHAPILAHTQMLDIALRAAGALKNARGLLPESLRSEGEIVAVLLAGQELGLPPMAAIRGLQVVRGKVIISYDTMIALLRRAGYRIAWTASSATAATLRLTAPDGETHTETWDEPRAKRAGLWGTGTWAKYPETMLKARCVSSAARAFAGDVLAGVYVEGEIEPAIIARAETIEPAPARVTRAEVVEPEQESTGTPVPERFADCVEADELHAFATKRRAAFARLANGRRAEAIQACDEAAARCGVEPALAREWCGLGDVEEAA